MKFSKALIFADDIGTPPAPALVADSLTATSLSLEWEGSRFSNISYLVEWRYEELAGTWQYCRNQSWGPHSIVVVENLQPYTKYRDIPASENTDFYMFKNLLPSRNYTVSVSMRNGVGEGPPATTLVSTLPEPIVKYFITAFVRERVDLRGNTQRPMFQNVVSLAMANGLFYWTNGEEVWTEEYHPGQNSYFHSAYPDLSNRSFVSVSVNLPTSQPMPIPVNPPTSVQAILGAELAKTSWQMPHLLGGQGPLCYFSDHLLWLQDGRNAVIGDLNGQNTAIISGTSLSGLNMVAVLDPILHHYPSNYILYILILMLCVFNYK
ncbi:hypothetical protein C0J52_27875 [Blattella germanica]|nr:hypothetical protein C0J52_27875 [Blattella germanica]